MPTQPGRVGIIMLEPQKPDAGLAVARMVGHITYLSEQAMHNKFGRRLQTLGTLWL